MQGAEAVSVSIADRLCQAIRTFRAGDSILLRHLVRACQPDVQFVTAGEDPTLICQRPTLTVGIDPTGDITGCCAQVALALFGPLWPHIPTMQTAWKILHADARQTARDAVLRHQEDYLHA